MSSARRFVRLSVLSLSLPVAALAQSRPFLYTPTPSRGPIVYADLAYGHNLFAGLGPEQLEQRIGAQLRLSSRLTVAARASYAPSDGALTSPVSMEAELFGSLARPSSRLALSLGAGVLRDYRRTAVALGHIVAGYSWARTFAVGSLRLEHAFAASSGAANRRDPLDVITTLGVARQLGPVVRLGIETVGEDLEGLFEADEAEGGAKVMLGPSLTLQPRAARWALSIVAGPVLHISHSATPGFDSGPPRDLSTGAGYVVRTSLGYQW
jgi:hypothetical protein